MVCSCVVLSLLSVVSFVSKKSREDVRTNPTAPLSLSLLQDAALATHAEVLECANASAAKLQRVVRHIVADIGK